MAKSTTPSNEQLEIDQMAEAELERLQKQVRNCLNSLVSIPYVV